MIRRLKDWGLLAVVATAFGVAASLGVGAAQINSGLHTVFGLPVGPTWQVGIIAVVVWLVTRAKKKRNKK